MKTVLKLWLPLGAFLLAGAGAVNNRMSKEPTKKPLMTGYVHNGTMTNCYARLVDCTVVNTGLTCLSSDVPPQQVFGKSSLNMCTIELYKDVH
jgi:hypothetical protein